MPEQERLLTIVGTKIVFFPPLPLRKLQKFAAFVEKNIKEKDFRPMIEQITASSPQIIRRHEMGDYLDFNIKTDDPENIELSIYTDGSGICIKQQWKRKSHDVVLTRDEFQQIIDLYQQTEV